MKKRREDPLLSYLKHARNSDQHTIEPITCRRESRLEITAAEPSGRALIKRITLKPNEEFLISGDGNVRISFHPEELRPGPVVSRGVIYQVPTSYLGKAIASRDAILMAHVGLAFYANFLDQAEAFFGAGDGR